MRRSARHRTARRLAGPLVAACLAALAAPFLTSEPAAAAPLRASAATSGKFIGYAANAQLLCNNSATCTSGTDATYRNLAGTQFSQVTHENALKWEATEPNDNQYTFAAADGVIAFAQANNQIVHGHTLVWHSQTPGWVQSLSATAMRAAMQDHIATVVGRYASNPIVQSWDVVNEAFNEDGSRRQSFWQNTLGNGYIAEAFQAARAADSNARLCINDFNVEGVNAKSTAMFNLVQQLRQQNVPVDCVGLQAHLIVNQIPSSLQQNIQRFADLGVEVRITELDIRIPLPADATELQQQANNYATVINACKAVARCSGVTIWGIDDGHSWLPNSCCPEGAPLLWNASYQQKPAYAATDTALGGGTSDTTPPSVPGTPTASNVGSTTATLNWTASTDTGGSGLAGYNVHREQGTTDPLLASPTTNSVNLTGLTPNTQYQVYVRARDGAGNLSGNSGLVTFTTSGGGGGGCQVAYTMSLWGGANGFTANLTLTNTGTAPLSWTLTFTLPAGQALTPPGWSANWTPSGSNISATGLSWNTPLAAGQGTTIGFNGTHTGNTSEPTAFSVNGTACTVA
jgi:endo-1,4-beta-xylanase